MPNEKEDESMEPHTHLSTPDESNAQLLIVQSVVSPPQPPLEILIDPPRTNAVAVTVTVRAF